MRYEHSQPAVFFRQRLLPVARLCIECTNVLSFTDTAQHLVDGRHRVRISDSKQVHVSTITGNATTTVLLGNTRDRTRHQTVQRSHRPRHRAHVWRTTRSRLPSHEPVGSLDVMHHLVAPSGSAVELFRKLVESLAKLLSLVGLKMSDLVVLDLLTRRQTTLHNRHRS